LKNGGVTRSTHVS